MSNRPNPKRSPAVARAQQTGAGSNRTLWIAGAVVLVVGIALVVAIVVGGGSSSKDDVVSASEQNKGAPGTVIASGEVELGTVTVTGDPIPQGDNSEVGQVAPDLAGEDFAGQPVSITNDGKPKVVMFVAHWCPHCQREVPNVQAWLDANGMPSEVSLYSVATATDATRDNYPPSKWLVGKNWTVPVLVDDAAGTAAQAWGLGGYPYFVAVAADGTVVQRASGELTQAQFYDLIDAARSGSS